MQTNPMVYNFQNLMDGAKNFALSSNKEYPYFVVSVGVRNCKEAFTFQETRRDYVLLYGLKGVGRIGYQSASELLEEGTFLFLSEEFPRAYYPVSDNWEYSWIQVQGETLSQLYKKLNGRGRVFAGRLPGEWYQKAYHLLYQALKEHSPICNYRLSAVVADLVYELMSVKQRDGEGRISRQNKENILKVKHRIETEYTKELTVDQLAEDALMSKYHFIRLFKSITGFTPHEYLIHCRINASLHLLDETDRTIEEIARECGFQTLQNYISNFAKFNGQTPKRYRFNMEQSKKQF